MNFPGIIPYSDLMVFFFTGENVDAVWDEVSPLIEESIDNSDNEVSIENVHEWLRSGAAFLWVAMDNENKVKSALVTELIPTEKGLWCNIAFSWSNGHVKSANAVFNTVESESRKIGCSGS